MIDYRIPPEDNGRIVTQFFPDTTGKTCQISSTAVELGAEYLPLVGWATVVRFREGELHRATFEPVVNDEYHGPVPLGDLAEEVGPLTLVDIS